MGMKEGKVQNGGYESARHKYLHPPLGKAEKHAPGLEPTRYWTTTRFQGCQQRRSGVYVVAMMTRFGGVVPSLSSSYLMWVPWILAINIQLINCITLGRLALFFFFFVFGVAWGAFINQYRMMNHAHTVCTNIYFLNKIPYIVFSLLSCQ